MTGPSPRELQALRFIERHTNEFGRAPFQSQIGAHLKLDSRGFLCRMLNNMERKGLITRRRGQPRSVRVIA
jgi:DNA-binding MarR family transcriptional regulator